MPTGRRSSFMPAPTTTRPTLPATPATGSSAASLLNRACLPSLAGNEGGAVGGDRLVVLMTPPPATRAPPPRFTWGETASSPLFLEGLLARLLDAGQGHQDEQERGGDQQSEADRPLDEHHRIATR